MLASEIGLPPFGRFKLSNRLGKKIFFASQRVLADPNFTGTSLFVEWRGRWFQPRLAAWSLPPHITLRLSGLGSAFGSFAVKPWDCWTGFGSWRSFSRSELFLVFSLFLYLLEFEPD